MNPVIPSGVSLFQALFSQDKLMQKHLTTRNASLGCISGIQDAGLVVGKDVHVINVETCDLPAFYNPLIPGLRQNFHSVGTVLSKYIIKLIEGEDPKKLQYIEKATFYPRDEK